MKKAPYSPKTTTSVNTLRTWLQAVGVGVRPSTTPGFDLTVTAADGSDLEVMVSQREDPTLPSPGVSVSAKAFTGKRVGDGLAAFWRVTDAAGYDRRTPVDRGPEGTLNAKGNPRKLRECEDPFGIAIRLTEFKRTVNPPNDRWKRYNTTIENVAYKWLYRNYQLCARHGIGADDLMSYARCHTVNFATLYETATPVHCDNERKLYKYIWQRFCSDLYPILRRQERSTLPDLAAAELASCVDTTAGTGYKRSHNPEDDYVWAIDNRSDIFEAQSIMRTLRTERADAEADMARLGAIEDRYVAQHSELTRNEVRRSRAFRNDPVVKEIQARLGAYEERLRRLDEVEGDAVDDDDYDYIEVHCELDRSSPNARRRSASDRLNQLLDDLARKNPERLVEILTEKASDMNLDHAGRLEARRQLRARVGEEAVAALDARHAELAGDENLQGVSDVDEELAGADAGGAAE